MAGRGNKRDGLLTDIFLELSDTLVDDYDLIDFLDTLAERCVRLIDAVLAAGIMLAGPDGMPQTVAASSEDTRFLEAMGADQGQGPWWDCFQSGTPTVSLSLSLSHAHATWPRMAARALELGFTHATTVPMRLREQTIGALTLFHADPAGLSLNDVRLGQALANAATIGILQERAVRDSRDLSEQLQRALTSRVLIEQAKGFLSARLGLTPDAAFDRLRKSARARQMPLAQLAQQVLVGVTPPQDLDPADNGSH